MGEQTSSSEKVDQASALSGQPYDRPLRHNWLSMGGFALALLGVLGTLTIASLAMRTGSGVAYGGLSFVLMGMLVGAGAALYVGGIVIAKFRRKRGVQPQRLKLMTLDLNKQRDRSVAIAVLVVGFVSLGVVATASYHSVHYVESNDFCSNMCHAVMAPEGTAHGSTAHARVDCVDCHVGSGAESFIAAKLSGLRQLWGVATGDFNRPIPTPIHNMKPAHITCEQCHWSGRYVDFKEYMATYFASDENNTVHRVRMLMKIGGPKGSRSLKGTGIHFHMTVGRKVEFVARDRRKQDIALVRAIEHDGTVREFTDRGSPLTDEEKATLPVHLMDCMDCHNRPAHQFGAPMPLMNSAMALGQVDPSIPFIKLKGVEVLSATYDSQPEGLQRIEQDLRAFYMSEHNAFYKTNQAKVDEAIAAIQDIFKHNMFPEMKADWRAYPDNIGHMIYPGCFRCHNDSMADSEGSTISTSCTACHLVLAQGAELSDIEAAQANFVDGEIFYHFADDAEMEEYVACVDCHTGGADMY